MHWCCSCLIYRPAAIECHSFCFLSSTFGNKSWASLYEEETPAVLLQLRSLISMLMCIYILTAVPDIFGLCWANHLGKLFAGCIQKTYVLHFPDWHKTHLLVRPRGLSYCSAKKQKIKRKSLYIYFTKPIFSGSLASCSHGNSVLGQKSDIVWNSFQREDFLSNCCCCISISTCKTFIKNLSGVCRCGYHHQSSCTCVAHAAILCLVGAGWVQR